MKVEDRMRIKDKVPSIIRTHNWDGEDIKIELSAFERKCDIDLCDPKGNVINNSYKVKEIREAFKDFLDCTSKGFEDVCLSIYNHDEEPSTFSITINKDHINVSTTTNITLTDKKAKKLSQMKTFLS